MIQRWTRYAIDTRKRTGSQAMTQTALHRQLKIYNTKIVGQKHVKFSIDPKTDFMANINTTGTSCNSEKALQSMTQPMNGVSSTSSTTSSVGLSSFVAKKETLTADICWAIKAITSHYSNKSCKNIGNIFQFMFPDSLIAKTFTCAEEKIAHLLLRHMF